MSKSKDKPIKAFMDQDFLDSSDARSIRILSEYLGPKKRFRDHNIEDTIVFFGSARAPSNEKLKNMLGQKDLSSSKKEMLKKLNKYREDAVELSRRLTKWSMSKDHNSRFVICSGGGPGMMEAANEGAHLAGGKSLGLNISLPMEQLPNQFISEGLSLDFHYFFMRKFWFAYIAKVLVVFPGGFGTLDELFEILTLIQTEKLQKRMAIIVYGTEYWDEIININKMEEWGTISKEDLSLFKFSDSIDDAFGYITSYLDKHYLIKHK